MPQKSNNKYTQSPTGAAAVKHHSAFLGVFFSLLISVSLPSIHLFTSPSSPTPPPISSSPVLLTPLDSFLSMYFLSCALPPLLIIPFFFFLSSFFFFLFFFHRSHCNSPGHCAVTPENRWRLFAAHQNKVLEVY